MIQTRLLSIQVGLPRTFNPPAQKPYTSAIEKQPVTGQVLLSRTSLEGDQLANQKVHGGLDKAVNVYASEHYPHWMKELDRPKIPFGSFGENFTTQGLLEGEVCVGDIFHVGQAVVQISQPRQPCATLARKWGVPDFINRVNRAGMTGWYLRVLQEGQVQGGEDLVLEERPYPEWTITRANVVMAAPRADITYTRALIACPALSQDWQDSLFRKIS